MIEGKSPGALVDPFVRRGGIEPPTRGFSVPTFEPFYPAFLKLAGKLPEKRSRRPRLRVTMPKHVPSGH
jgi:hypothetical protein